jgi:hypothetical protein
VCSRFKLILRNPAETGANPVDDLPQSQITALPSLSATILKYSPWDMSGTVRLLDADSGFGEEIAEAPSLIALRLNERLLSQKMAGVFERAGEEFVLFGIGLETQDFRTQGEIETEADLVGFAIDLRWSHYGFGISCAAG